jgi:cytoskeletal protein RodZ
MKTAGQMLQAARVARKLELDDVLRITKIRPQFLALIEADDYQKLPSGAVAKGFIRNYSEFLDLNPIQVLAIFRRDFIENQAGQIVPRGFVEPVNKQAWWTPRTTVISVVSLVLTLFMAYLIYQYRILTGPPRLTIDQAEMAVTTHDPSFEISGLTDPEATISVNGQLVVLDKGGKFFFRIPLSEGENLITITSTSKSGKPITKTRSVIYSSQ